MKFQIIYKQRIYTDNIDTIEDALESLKDIKEASEKRDDNIFDEKYFSIEVEIARDSVRHNGRGDTRATIEELAQDYMDKNYKEALAKVEEMKRILR